MIPANKLLDLSGQTAIVTGGAAGIGLGISKRLAEAGANVVIADTNKKGGADAVNGILDRGGRAIYIEADVSKQKDVSDIVTAAIKTFGQINILVNNVGIYNFMPLIFMPEANFDRTLAVNLKSVFLMTQRVAEEMLKRDEGGRIINITSIDAVRPYSYGFAHYDASKQGVWALTQSTALEFARYGITVNAVAPGHINTPGVKSYKRIVELIKGRGLAPVVKTLTNKIPLGRMGEPDDIAKAVLFLASDMSSYITGAQIIVDGGMLLV